MALFCQPKGRALLTRARPGPEERPRYWRHCIVNRLQNGWPTSLRTAQRPGPPPRLKVQGELDISPIRVTGTRGRERSIHIVAREKMPVARFNLREPGQRITGDNRQFRANEIVERGI